MRKVILLLSCICLLGCSAKDSTPSQTTAPVTEANTKITSYTSGVQVSYTFLYPDQSKQEYTMDGLIKLDDTAQQAYLQMNLASLDLNSQLKGYYDNGKLYTTYNGITYYEQMSYEDVQKLMLVPILPYDYSNIAKKEEKKGQKETTFQLGDSKSIFLDHYDFYGFKDYQGLQMTSSEVKQSFDDQGKVVDETAKFVMQVEVQGQNVQVTYQYHCGILDQNKTLIGIDDKLRKSFDSYVAFKDIDTSKISSEPEIDDSEKETPLLTLQSRLQSRLNYKIENGYYVSNFNDGQMYQIDFDNHVFIFRNQSSTYSYNWQADFGGFGETCTFDFKTENQSSGCKEDTVNMIKDTKKYFLIELYYCGVSLDDILKG